MDKRICPVCGKEFIPNTDNQVCCSSHCAAIKNGIETRKYRKCLYCGKLFWIPNASKCRLRYCCDECKQKAHEERYSKKEKPVKQPKRKVCAWCGREFEAFTNTSFCSKQCGYEANNKLQRERWREKYKPKRLICKECGKEFVTECGDTHSVFCCSACAKANEKRQERQTDRHKRAVARSKEIRKKQIKKTLLKMLLMKISTKETMVFVRFVVCLFRLKKVVTITGMEQLTTLFRCQKVVSIQWKTVSWHTVFVIP